MERVTFRTQVLAKHLQTPTNLSPPPSLQPSLCLHVCPAELSEKIEFNVKQMRKLMDGHDLEYRDWIYGLMIQSDMFGRKEIGGKVYVGQDYNEPMQVQREMTLRRLLYLVDHGVFNGVVTEMGSPEGEMRRFAVAEVTGLFDKSLTVKQSVHYNLW